MATEIENEHWDKQVLCVETCAECGDDAAYFDPWCNSFLCSICVKQHSADGAPVTKIGD